MFFYLIIKKLLLPIIERLFLYKSNIKCNKISKANYEDSTTVNDVCIMCDNLLEINQYHNNNYPNYDTEFKELFKSRWNKIYQYVILNTSTMLKVIPQLNKLAPELKKLNIGFQDINFNYKEIHKEFFSNNTVEYVLNKLSIDQIIKWCKDHRIKEYYTTECDKNHNFTYKFKYYWDTHTVDPNTYTIQDKINVHNALCCDLIKYYLSNVAPKEYIANNEKRQYYWIFNVDNELKNYLNNEDKLEKCVKEILKKDKQDSEECNELYNKLEKIYYDKKYEYNYQYFENKKEINVELIEKICGICKKLRNFFIDYNGEDKDLCRSVYRNFETAYTVSFKLTIERILKKEEKDLNESNKAYYKRLKEIYYDEKYKCNDKYFENKKEITYELLEEVYNICDKFYYPKYNESFKFNIQDLHKNITKFENKANHIKNQLDSTQKYNDDLEKIFKIYSENKDKLNYEIVSKMENKNKYLNKLFCEYGLLNEKDENGHLNIDMYLENGIPTERQQAFNILMYKENIAENIIIKSTICYLFNDINNYKENPDSNSEISDEEFYEQYEYTKKLNEVINELLFNNKENK